MRSDIVPGAVFPDYELRDHTETPRRLSELQGEDPMILTLARGHYCPKRAPAASGARRVLPQDRRGVHADRDDRDRRPPHAPGISRIGWRSVAFSLGPWTNRPEGISRFRNIPIPRRTMGGRHVGSGTREAQFPALLGRVGP